MGEVFPTVVPTNWCLVSNGVSPENIHTVNIQTEQVIFRIICVYTYTNTYGCIDSGQRDHEFEGEWGNKWEDLEEREGRTVVIIISKHFKNIRHYRVYKVCSV